MQEYAAPANTAIGVLTSGGDAQGMNAALRAVVRTALSRGVAVYAIYEGYQGMIDGGQRIRPLGWNDVGGIMYRGGTIIGTARCAAFRTRPGRLQAARNLIERGIDRLVVIGGDGSLTGADTFRQEWATLLTELVETEQIPAGLAAQHPHLAIVGLVGSIDNDFCGTDMTIGADTALYRITEAIDAISSTAASHQRTFIVEVMGRNCGYLALMGAISGGADYVLIPEQPPESGWEQEMCDLLHAGRAAGRRDSIVVIAEGAHDQDGNPITSDGIKRVLEERLHADTRITILGHVQRGGTPSAFDRWMSTLLGYYAVDELLAGGPEREPQLIGLRNNRFTHAPLMECVAQTRSVAQAIKAHEYTQAMALRGGSFTEMYATFRALARALPSIPHGKRSQRLAVLHAGGPAPGMNTAIRAAIRLGLDQGHVMLAIRNGFPGLIAGQVEEFTWGSVDGWGPTGGAELGTSRTVLREEDLEAVARALAANQIDGLLMVGGYAGYLSAALLNRERERHPALNIPIICLPTSINNNLPGSEHSIGADTALNTIVTSIDKIKQSAVAVRRCFVIEVMGGACGYLALMSGLASGAERAYLAETGISIALLEADLNRMAAGFAHGKRLSVIVRNERANPYLTTEVIHALFAAGSNEQFDVRDVRLGHIQQGGSPSPFDRIQATRLAARCIAFLNEQIIQGSAAGACIGIRNGHLCITSLDEMPMLVDPVNRRPHEQWWLALEAIADTLAHEPHI